VGLIPMEDGRTIKSTRSGRATIQGSQGQQCFPKDLQSVSVVVGAVSSQGNDTASRGNGNSSQANVHSKNDSKD
jgi:hypothetical protein